MRKDTKALTLKLSNPQLVVLARGMVQSMFDMVVNGKTHAAAPVVLSPSMAGLPAIGAEYQGGIYAGLTIHDNQVAALILLPGDEKLDWNAAMAWAEKQGGVLPSRFDQLVLFKNLKKEFKEEWYWSSPQCAPLPSFAWSQDFSSGVQSYYHKGYDFRARAVRRSVIQ